MVGLKLRPKKKKTSARAKAAASADAPVTRFVWQAPHGEFKFGRQLAFVFGDAAIQMATASHLGTHISLLNVRKTYIPGSFETEDSRETFIRGAVQEYVEEFGGRKPSIALAIDGPETALRSILMPDLRPSELKEAVEFEGKRQIPFPMPDCQFDFRPVQKVVSGNERKIKVALLAATKRLVQTRLKIFKDLGLSVNRVYHSQDVIGQLLPALPQFQEDFDYALVNVQRDRSEISYYHGGNLAFFHVSSLGSSSLSNRSDPTMFEYFAESLATEIQNSLDYYAGQYSSQFSNQIYVYGDLAYSDELIGRLTDRFGLTFLKFPSEMLSFVHQRKLEFEDTIPVCLPVVAAATCRYKLADLLPREDKAAHRASLANRMGLAASFLAAGLVTVGWMSQISTVQTAQNELNGLQQEVERFRASEMFATYNHLKRSIAASQKFLSQTKEAPSFLSLNLKELSRMAPEPVRLSILDYRADAGERNLNIAGVVVTQDTPPELALAEFVENLEASPFYSNVQVDRNVKKRLPKGFQLEFHVSMEGTI